MDVLDVANHDTVHKAPGMAAEEVASRTGIGYAVLNNKVNWAVESNKLAQREAIALQLVTGTREIIRAECKLLGGHFMESSLEPDVDIPTAVLNASAEHGDVGRAICDALGDGDLTAREEAHIDQQITEAINALNALRMAVRLRSDSNEQPGAVQLKACKQ
mgnify:CR=1 FL=1